MSPKRFLAFPLLLLVAAAVACGPGEPPAEEAPAPEPEAAEETVLVTFETAMGEVEVELYPERAPLSVAQFLRYVDGAHYDGASFYRATRTADGHSFDIVQGGRSRMPMLTGEDPPGEPPFPPIPHETTHQTGMRNERGVLSYARLGPGNRELGVLLQPRRQLHPEHR